ncbi:MAG: hypothetical protein J5662_04930 [Clostridia bacterium]|nr:hypothetical protein [Clostridia bacterium]
MDDINRKLEDILNDPESMERVRQMAGALLGEDAPEKDGRDGDSKINSEDVGRMMNLISRLENRENDNRAKLLLALKPHLTGKRQEKVDSAVKLLKLIEALPLLKEAGIFDFR